MKSTVKLGGSLERERPYMEWDRSDLYLVAQANCVTCHGTGVRREKKGQLIPCACASRAIFRSCYTRFRDCVTRGKYRSHVFLSAQRAEKRIGQRGRAKKRSTWQTLSLSQDARWMRGTIGSSASISCWARTGSSAPANSASVVVTSFTPFTESRSNLGKPSTGSNPMPCTHPGTTLCCACPDPWNLVAHRFPPLLRPELLADGSPPLLAPGRECRLETRPRSVTPRVGVRTPPLVQQQVSVRQPLSVYRASRTILI